MQHLSGNWADVLAWVILLAGVVACAAFIVRLTGPRAPVPPLAVTETIPDEPVIDGPRRLGREREWALIVRHAARDLDRRAALAGLQADAALKIAAAEHAFNRLVVDYASLCGLSATAAAAPPPRPAATPGKSPGPPQRPEQGRPLAA